MAQLASEMLEDSNFTDDLLAQEDKGVPTGLVNYIKAEFPDFDKDEGLAVSNEIQAAMEQAGGGVESIQAVVRRSRGGGDRRGTCYLSGYADI
jgi:hypothetical protein